MTQPVLIASERGEVGLAAAWGRGPMMDGLTGPAHPVSAARTLCDELSRVCGGTTRARPTPS